MTLAIHGVFHLIVYKVLKTDYPRVFCPMWRDLFPRDRENHEGRTTD